MNNGIGFIFGFTAGAAVGALVAWKVLRTKYDQITREEIDSVKEMYSNKYEEKEPYVHDDWDSIQPTDYEKYVDLTEKYSNEEEKGGSKPVDELIRVIPPEEVGDNEDYEVITLWLYSDKVLVDDSNEPIEDPELILGPDALSSFGKYEDDSVFVQNDDRGCYYEILLDDRTYHDKPDTANSTGVMND